MSDGVASLNNYSKIQVLKAKSPDTLTRMIRQLRVPLFIDSFDNNGREYFCYFRSNHIIKVKER